MNVTTACPDGALQRSLPANGVAKRPGRQAEPASERLDEVRRLAIAHQSCDVGHREGLMAEQLCRVVQPHGAEVRREGRQADLVVGALQLTRRNGEGARDQWEGQWAPVSALDHRPGAQVELSEPLGGRLTVVHGSRCGWSGGDGLASDRRLACGTAVTRRLAAASRRPPAPAYRWHEILQGPGGVRPMLGARRPPHVPPRGRRGARGTDAPALTAHPSLTAADVDGAGPVAADPGRVGLGERGRALARVDVDDALPT